MGLTIIGLTLSGCTEKENNGTNEASIHAYVGAGLQQPMDEIGKEFEKKYHIKVNYDYAGGGLLYSKVLASNKGDIFMPGTYFYVNELNKKGYITEVANITKHIPVIVVKKGNPKNITSLEDLGKPGIKLALNDEDNCIGRTFNKILSKAEKDHPDITKRIKNNTVVKGATVKQTLIYVELGQVDAGVVWRADAIEDKDKVNIIPINPKYNIIKTVPIAILKTTKNKKNARLFYDFVNTKGKEIFKKYGYEVVE